VVLGNRAASRSKLKGALTDTRTGGRRRTKGKECDGTRAYGKVCTGDCVVWLCSKGRRFCRHRVGLGKKPVRPSTGAAVRGTSHVAPRAKVLNTAPHKGGGIAVTFTRIDCAVRTIVDEW